MTTLADVAAAAGGHCLAVNGVVRAKASEAPIDGRFRTIVLFGPGAGFWTLVTASTEFANPAPHPLDRWSIRVISGIARSLGGEPLFPFGGPPFAPFPDWALKSGRCWSSPVNLLVHDHSGLMVSFRGAAGFADDLKNGNASSEDESEQTEPSPCDQCPEQPCRSACPVGALTADGYDIARCKAFLMTESGQDCMQRGCAVRRSCPLSAGAGRKDAQSAFHMRAFL